MATCRSSRGVYANSPKWGIGNMTDMEFFVIHIVL